MKTGCRCFVTKKTIPVILSCLFMAGCVSTKVPLQNFINDDKDSLFISGYVSSGKMNGIVECLGYQNDGYQVLSEGSGEDVKRLGLILPAKSILYTSHKMRAAFGNETDSCILLFNKTYNETRKGRSALISVSNLVSNVKGDPYTPQNDPTVSLTSVVSEGTIMLNDQISGFYYKRNFDGMKRIAYEGWLVLRGDTITAKQVRDRYDDNGKMINDNWTYYHWLQLVKNGATYAAAFVSNTSTMKVYVSKNLSEAEKMLIAAYFSVIVYRSK